VAAGFLVAALWWAGVRLRRPLSPGHPLLRRMWAVLLPLGLAGLFQQYELVDRIFASYFGRGSLSLLRLGSRLYEAPIALFCVSVGTAVFPRMCAAGASGDRAALQVHLATSVRRAMYFTLPAMLGILALADPFVRVAFQRGAFGEADTVVAARCLMAYALGLAAAGLRPLLARAVFAVNRHAWYILVEVLALVLNVALNVVFALVLGWGVFGVAFSTAVTSFVVAGVLWVLVSRFVGLDEMAGLRAALVKMAGCATLMGAACYGLWHVTAPARAPGLAVTGVRLGAVVAFGAALYVAATSMVRLEEYEDLRGLYDKFIRRRRG
jgi:putative peptidoglycan lipid II flippase